MSEHDPNKQYCPICGKRRLPHVGSHTIQHLSGSTVTYHFYLSTSTEPACFGHRDTPAHTEQTVIPKAFYDAFAHEENT